jgi:hypothetical protein
MSEPLLLLRGNSVCCSVSSCLREQGMLRPRDKICGLPNPEQSQLSPASPYPGGTTSNFKQLYSMLTGAQYQTSYQLTATKKRGKVKKTEGTSASREEAAVVGLVKTYCSWSATRCPPFSQNPPQRKSYSCRQIHGVKIRFVKGFDLHT